MRQPPVKRMIGGSIPPAGADIECGNWSVECGIVRALLPGFSLSIIRGSANGRLPDFESGDGGSNPSPRTELGT